MKDRDIFDRMMSCKLFRFAYPFYAKYKEQLLYLFFGALTTGINFVVFAFFTQAIVLNELIANAIAWVFAVLFAYVTNRIWVFSQKAKGKIAISREILAFYLGRVFTFLIEELILFIFISCLNMHAMLIKVIAQILVLIGNYIVSKCFVFRKNKKMPPQA